MTAEQLLSTIRAFFAGSIADAETSRSVAVLFSIRIPRVLLACAVGAALAVSGAAYQGIFRNPMVSPDILGVSNAASVGVALGLLWGFPPWWCMRCPSPLALAPWRWYFSSPT